jgi:N-methylhydantoinase B
MRVFDPITTEIIWSKLISALDEAASTLVRTAFSPVVREANDFACVLTDTRGESIGQSGLSAPSFLNTIPITVRAFIRRFGLETLKPGDVLLTNDPWLASGHLPDVTVATPIFYKGKIVAFAGACAHMTDMGGRQRSTDARELYEEGLQIPMCKLWEAGEPDEIVLNFLTENVRVPEDVIGDLTAATSALETCRRRTLEILTDYAFDDFTVFGPHIQAISERSMRKAIAEIPDGEYCAETRVDGVTEPLFIKCALRVDGDKIEVDYTGSSPRQPVGINSVLNYTYSYTVYPIKCVIDPNSRNNAGSFWPITIIAPEDSILNPRKPAPVGGRSVTGNMLHDPIFRCLAQAVPEKVQAGSYGPGWTLTTGGRRRDGRNFAGNFINTGGQGASAEIDGISCVRYPSNVCNTPVEMLENAVPLLVEDKSLRANSGGPGQKRGGLGQRVAYRSRSDEPMTISLLADRTREGALGLAGGEAGGTGRASVNGEAVNAKLQFQLPPGGLLVLETPGGGGHGDPKARLRELVRRDLALGYITPDHAAGVYGFSGS